MDVAKGISPDQSSSHMGIFRTAVGQIENSCRCFFNTSQSGLRVSAAQVSGISLFNKQSPLACRICSSNPEVTWSRGLRFSVWFVSLPLLSGRPRPAFWFWWFSFSLMILSSLVDRGLWEIGLLMQYNRGSAGDELGLFEGVFRNWDFFCLSIRSDK